MRIALKVRACHPPVMCIPTWQLHGEWAQSKVHRSFNRLCIAQEALTGDAESHCAEKSKVHQRKCRVKQQAHNFKKDMVVWPGLCLVGDY